MSGAAQNYAVLTVLLNTNADTLAAVLIRPRVTDEEDNVDEEAAVNEGQDTDGGDNIEEDGEDEELEGDGDQEQGIVVPPFMLLIGMLLIVNFLLMLRQIDINNRTILVFIDQAYQAGDDHIYVRSLGGVRFIIYLDEFEAITTF